MSLVSSSLGPTKRAFGPVCLCVAASVVVAGCGGADPRARALATMEVDEAAMPVLSGEWKLALADLTQEERPQEFASAALSESGHAIYIGSKSGQFFALKRQSGEVLWRVPLGSVSSRPVVFEGRIYVGTDDGAMVCLRALDGSELWRYATRGPVLEPPAVTDDAVYFANENDHVYGLDRKTGKFRWQYKSDTPDEYTLRGHAGVAVLGDLVFSGFANGNLVALRGSTGSVAWITSLAAGADRFVDVDATPVVDGDSLFASSSAGGVFEIDAVTGRIKWRLEVNGAGAVAVDDEFIYFGAADTGIYAVDRAGFVVWRQGTRGGGEAAVPQISGDYLFYAMSEAGLFVANKRSGAVHQYFDPGFGISAPPTVAGDSLYVLSNSAIVYALHLDRP